MSPLGAGYRISRLKRGRLSRAVVKFFSGIRMDHAGPSWWRHHRPDSSPLRLAIAKERLDDESRRLLDSYLRGHDVNQIATLHGMTRDSVAALLAVLVKRVQSLVARIPEGSAEGN